MTYRAVRRVAFRIDPERAHRLGLLAARLGRPVATLRSRRLPAAPVEAFGLHFRNPIGLAAGYDKDGRAWRALAALGFGHVEVGTVTPQPQPGNPGVRIDRVPDRSALVNRLGFPSDGAAAVARRLDGRRPPGVVLGVSLGPNADTPPERRIDDYLQLVDVFAPLADYLAINVSSPNTPGLRDLEGAGALGDLVRDIAGRRGGERAVPLLVKLSPDIDDIAAAAVEAVEAGADGLIVTNTTVRRDADTAGLPPGGLSGAPLAPLASRRLRSVLGAVNVPVIASGGLMTPGDVWERLDAGAQLVQLYTGLVYRGPRLVREALRPREASEAQG